MGKVVTIKGKKFKIKPPTRKGKKYKACPVNGLGKCYHFGAKGFHARPNTPKGNNYCARSSGIKGKGGIGPNDFARALWNCNGKKSMSR